MQPRLRIDRVLPAKAARPDTALDLAEIDPAVWHVLGRGKAHGPFTLGQLLYFADNSKIGPMTRISSGHGEPFLPARENQMLRSRLARI